MSDIGARMPWRVWFRVHTKAICQAVPMSFLVVAEARDMFYRATWDVAEISPASFRTGDVVSICNRWYTLPTWGQVVYSLLTKVLLKSSWDDVGVISVKEGIPYLIYTDFSGAQEVPLDVFLAHRQPRGVAVRRLQLDEGTPPLSTSVSDMFVTEVRKIPPRPWYLFSASMRNGNEHTYYEYAVSMNEQRQKVKEMVHKKQSFKAIEVQVNKLRDMEVMRKHLAEFVDTASGFSLFNGSLVASFLATYGLIDRALPQPTRYVPQDFSRDIPFLGATKLEEPVVFFKT